MDLTLVILAAGIGSRYGGLKQMDPVGPSGEFILDYSIYDGLRAGFNKVVFVIRRDIEAVFKAAIGDRVGKRVRTDYVFQELTDLPPGYTVPAGRSKPWGTAHAVLTSARAVNEPFVALNADDYYGRDAYAALAGFLRETYADASAYAMAAYLLRHTMSEHGSVARGLCTAGPDGNLKSVVEQTKIEKVGDRILCAGRAMTGDELVSMNIWGLKPSIYGHLQEQFARFLAASGSEAKSEFFMPTVVGRLIDEAKASVRVLETGSAWFGMTNPADRVKVVAGLRELIDAGVYPADLWK